MPDRIELNEKDKGLISAFRYANNSLKHCIEVKTIAALRGGLVFPMHFPLAIPERKIVWSIVGNGDSKYENQRTRYKEFLSGKDVMETCKCVIDMLENIHFEILVLQIKDRILDLWTIKIYLYC